MSPFNWMRIQMYMKRRKTYSTVGMRINFPDADVNLKLSFYDTFCHDA